MRIFCLFLILLVQMQLVAQKPSAVPAISKAILGHDKQNVAVKDSVTESDTSRENKEPRYFYLTLGANVFVNTDGDFAKRFAPSLEFGRTYGIFDIGFTLGRLNSRKSAADTSIFFEIRPTINIFSKGRFSEALCLGAGYVVNAKEGLVTEICNSINFNISEIIAIAVVQGYYFFDGTNNNRSTQYMGLNITFNFLKNHSVNKQRKRAAIVNEN